MTKEKSQTCRKIIISCTNKISILGIASEDWLRLTFCLYVQTTGKGKVPMSQLHGRPSV